MRIGIIGASHIGATVARLLTGAGHQVALSNSRGPALLAQLIQDLGFGSQAMPAVDTACYGDVVLRAVPWAVRSSLPEAHLFADKILIDAMSRCSAQFEVLEPGECSSSEAVAQQFPDSQGVKAFNTLFWETLATRGTKHVAHRIILPLAGDGTASKATVSALISDCGFAPFDTGMLREGGILQQPGNLFYGKTLTVKEAEQVLESGEWLRS